MKLWHKLLLGVCIITALILFGYGDYYLWKLLSAGAGVEAKMLCSSVFISGRTPESVLSEDLHHRVNYIRLKVDAVNRIVTATAFGVIRRQACFREGLGSTLIAGDSDGELLPPVTVNLKPKPLKQR